jgi:hypothetical protein
LVSFRRGATVFDVVHFGREQPFDGVIDEEFNMFVVDVSEVPSVPFEASHVEFIEVPKKINICVVAPPVGRLRDIAHYRPSAKILEVRKRLPAALHFMLHCSGHLSIPIIPDFERPPSPSAARFPRVLISGFHVHVYMPTPTT